MDGTQKTSLNDLLSMSIDPFPQTRIYLLLAIMMCDNEQNLNDENILYDEDM